MTALLEVQDVTVAFGGLVALAEVSATVGHNEVVGVIGPNGAGKTTLFNVVCGFIRPSGGRIVWKGEELHDLQPRQLARLGIARTMQGLGLFPHLSVLDNVLVGASRHARLGLLSSLFATPAADRENRQLRDRALRVLEELAIADVAGALPGQLSYGLQKRAALARVLVAEPEMLLLDEPASGLSNEEMRELGHLIHELRPRMSVLLVEHHMDLVMDVCDRIVVLDFGRLVVSGTPDSIRDDPRVLEAYLGQVVDETTGEVSDAGR